MLLTAYLVPAFAWFANLFSPHSKVKKVYAVLYFIFHALVETYALVMPLLWNLKYWSNTQLSITVHPLFHNQGEVLGTITIKLYLIVNTCVLSSMLMFTSYATMCLWTYAKVFNETKELTEAKEKLLAS